MATDIKAQNARWLWIVMVVDVVALIPLVVTSGSFDELSVFKILTRGAAATVAPVIVLLLTSLLTADVKAVVVFWRIRDMLPGHRAFSIYAHRDSRINLEELRRKVGEFPVLPRDQNAAWYGLYKAVVEDPGVMQSLRNYLLFRDLSILSLMLSIVALIITLVTGGTIMTAMTVFGLLFAQYVLSAIAARNNGIRLVTNVLALHGVAQ